MTANITQTGQGYQVGGAGQFYSNYNDALAALNATQTTPTTGMGTAYNSTTSSAPAVITAQPAKQRINEMTTGLANMEASLNVPQATTTQVTQPSRTTQGFQPTPPPTDPNAQKVLAAYNNVFQNKMGWTPDMSFYLTPEFAGKTQQEIEALLQASDEYKSGVYLQPGGRGNPLAEQMAQQATQTEPAQPEYVSEYQKGLADIMKQREELYQDYKSQLEAFKNGTFQLSPAEQAYLNSMQALFDQQIAAQKIANKNYEGAIVNAGIAAGRNRYAPEIEAGNIQGAISSGISKVQELQAKAMTSMFELKQALEDKHYRRASDLFDLTTKYLNDKQKTVEDTYNAVRTAIKDQQEMEDRNLKRAKDLGETLAAVAYNAMGSDEAFNAGVISDLAAQYGIDPNFLIGAVQEYERKAKKDEMAEWSPIYKEYQNYKLEELMAGRTPVDFNSYQTMDVNRKARIARAGAPVINAETGLTKTQQAFLDDAFDWISKLGAQEATWATAWNAMRARYPMATNDEIDQALNKSAYYKVK